MHERVAAVYYDRIVPQLSALFDEYGQADRRIPQLTIDCGVLREANWEQELTEAVIDRLREELVGSLRGTPTAVDAPPERWANELAYFLKQGRWQWDSAVESTAHLEQSFHWNRAALDTVIDVLRASGDAVDRLFHYFSADFVRRLSEALLARVVPDGTDCLAWLEQARVAPGRIAQSAVRAYARHGHRSNASEPFATYWMALLWPALTREEKAGIVEQAVVAEVKSRQGDALDDESIERPTTRESRAFFASFLALIASEFPESATLLRQRRHTDLFRHTDGNGTQVDARGRPSGRQSADRVEGAAEKPAAVREASVDGGDDASWYVRNAGLVLLYPFIEPLLRNIGFLDDEGRFLPNRQRDVPMVLQQVVYGSPLAGQYVDEQELALNKVLCGLPPEAFVDCTHVESTPAVQQACDELLAAVIGHWNVLRNTSIAGLQETFLQREGKLTIKGDQWRLHVESRGADVLLSSLPWSIGVIKLPWMDRLLHVEWTG